ncbi:MAG: PAS domain-containing protein [Magnetococcales bacterium]|nr:PAS domain-containing protein [Magnetococcales bacterium]
MNATFSPDNLFDQLPTGFITVDRRGVVRDVNSAAERLLGKPRRRLIGRPLSKLLPGHPVAEDLLNRAQQLLMPCRFRNAQIHPDPDTHLTVSLTACPLQDANGELAGAVLQLEEVSAAERLEEGERLNETLDSLGSMALAVAHEVKNPLAGIRGAAQILELECQAPATLECTRLIRDEVDRITRLLDTLLGLADDQPFMEGEINIHQILDHVLQICGAPPPLPQRDYDPSLPAIRGDRDQLVQLFLNLVKNAREAAGPEGRVEIHTRISQGVRLVQGQRRHHVIVEIRDNGPGIPAALRKRIFLPFVTTKSRGTGLGLAISRKIVNDHGGLMEVKSHPGQTLFRVLLPVAAP